uniref:Uncharacterized protein n=1 Tax=Culex tarsalis TaxID=7177 RepID=A0A1Q3G5F1_CULTA
MDIDVDDFMRKTTGSYNFQYIDLGDLDRIIRNVQRKTDEESAPKSLEVKAQAVRMLSDEEINAILESTELDLQEARTSMEEPILPVIVEPEPEPEFEQDDASDGASTICSSSPASSVKEFAKRVSDDVADIEDNLGDDFSVDDFMITFSGSQEDVVEQGFESIEPCCFEYLDSESIVEEVFVPQDGNEGDSEGSGKGPITTIRVKSPIKPASALIKTYEQECDDPVNDIQPVLDFVAIERATKNSRPTTARSVVTTTIKSRPPSRKSLVEEFDTFIKITELQKKVCVLIDDVRLCLGKLEEPEDELEEKKRERRTAEFLIRFQRNYLYQINRLEEDICVLNKGSPETAKKIYQLYRTVGQALKFYLKNMKYFVINVSPEKLWTLVKQILSSTKLCVQKDIFDEDDLIVGEINEKCHLLRHRLKEEVAKQKSRRSKSSQKPRKITSSHSANPLQGPKLSMYGTSSAAQKGRPSQARKSSSTFTRKPISGKKDPKRTFPKPPPLRKPPPPQGKIIAVPMIKSSCSSLGRTKSGTRVRSAVASRGATPAKTIDDVVTLIQQRTDPLVNSRLLKEVSGALTKMSGARDAAISPEINQQLHQLIMETIQNITQQQLQQMMPQVENSKPGESVTGAAEAAATTTTVPTTGENRQPTTEAVQVTGATDHASAAEKCFSTPAKLHPREKVARKSRDSSATVQGVDANRPPAGGVRDCVGDSQSSDSGKISSGTSGGGGVDLELCGGKGSCLSNLEVPEGLSSDGGGGGGGQGQAGGKPKGAKSLLEERKKRSQRLPRQLQPKPTQHKINYSHNLQYLEIVSLSDSNTNNNVNPGATATARRLVPEVQSHLNLAEEVANHERRQRREEFFAQLRKQVSRDRRKTIHRMATSPVYVNGNFERPWQTVSRVSDQLIEELIADTAQDGGLDFGERSFVEDFLRLQLGG